MLDQREHSAVIRKTRELCEAILLEPRTTLNTGNVLNERTVPQPERLA